MTAHRTRSTIAVLGIGAFALGGVACSSSSDSGSSSGTTSTSSWDSVATTSMPPGSSIGGSTPGTASGGTVYDVTGDETIQTTVGETFTIALEANSTTGYTWSEQIAGDAVTSDGGEYIAPENAMPGAGGQQRYTYTAVAAGTSTITLTYTQVGGEVGKTYTVTVEVS